MMRSGLLCFRWDSGQPFRLRLLHCLALITRDPDADYAKPLQEGVALGVDFPMPPCPQLPRRLFSPSTAANQRGNQL